MMNKLWIPYQLYKCDKRSAVPMQYRLRKLDDYSVALPEYKELEHLI